ncbi:transposase [Gluconacetobacter sacchari]|uniref:Transposase n=1 Tax=Gluconacetobacter sacchari TaxID=92759 RepID=A0A7W4ID30_9PROT|nr:transposase [Gluconacetobacter sacchari]
MACVAPGGSVTRVSRQHDISRASLWSWRRQFPGRGCLLRRRSFIWWRYSAAKRRDTCDDRAPLSGWDRDEHLP